MNERGFGHSITGLQVEYEIGKMKLIEKYVNEAVKQERNRIRKAVEKIEFAMMWSEQSPVHDLIKRGDVLKILEGENGTKRN